MTEETKDFVIKDRRFSAQEDKNQDNSEETKTPQPEQAETDSQTEKTTAQEKKSEPQLPEINFPTFIFSLNSSCLVQLGLLEDPATGQKSKNLALAKQTIDILGMLEEKTRVNLTTDEENMLKNILYDLRIIYVKEKG